MENKYWALILIGMIIVSVAVGFLIYKNTIEKYSAIGYDEGHKVGLEKGYLAGLEKYGRCAGLCTRGFEDNNDIWKISIDCLEYCEFDDPNYISEEVK